MKVRLWCWFYKYNGEDTCIFANPYAISFPIGIAIAMCIGKPEVWRNFDMFCRSDRQVMPFDRQVPGAVSIPCAVHFVPSYPITFTCSGIGMHACEWLFEWHPTAPLVFIWFPRCTTGTRRRCRCRCQREWSFLEIDAATSDIGMFDIIRVPSVSVYHKSGSNRGPIGIHRYSQ